MKQKFNRIFAIYFFFLTISIFWIAPISRAESLQKSYPQKVTFLYFNDFHGALEPIEKKANKQNSKPYTVFGIARMATKVKEVRKVNSQNKVETILVTSGDFLQGTLLSNHFKGDLEVELFSKMGLSYYSIGNHELDFGTDVLKKMIDTFNARGTPCVTSNLYIDGTPVGKPAIKEINGVKIGIAGLVAKEDFSLEKPIVDPTLLKDINVESEYEIAQKIAKDLKKDGVDFIVFLTHIGIDRDRELARAVKGINLIVGAHSHTPIKKYELVNKTYIVQAGCECQYLGSIDITITGSDSFKVENARLFLLDNKTALDQEVNKFVQSKKGELDKKLSRTIAISDCFLDGKRHSIRYQETNLGNFVTDVLRDYFHTDIAIYNSGGIRHSIDKGNITYAHVHQSLTFPFNQTVIFKIYGKELKELLQWNAKQFGSGGFLQVSGLSFDLSPGKEAKEIKINRKLVEEDKLYTLVTNSFIAKGGDGYIVLAKIPQDRQNVETNPTLIVIDYIKSHYGDLNIPISYCQSGKRIKIIK